MMILLMAKKSGVVLSRPHQLMQSSSGIEIEEVERACSVVGNQTVLSSSSFEVSINRVLRLGGPVFSAGKQKAPQMYMSC